MKKQMDLFASNKLRAVRDRLALRQFVADRRGATAVEFAMVSVPLLGLIGAIFESGMVYFNNAQLQTVTEIASRALLTNNGKAGQTYQQFINQSVCTWQSSGGNVVAKGTLSTAFDCSKIMVDISSPASWSLADATNDLTATLHPGNEVINLPASGQIAVVRIAYPMPVLAAILTGGAFAGQTIGHVATTGQTQMLLGVSAFRVEPSGS
jgi:Flp pilus assembly protein TadG